MGDIFFFILKMKKKYLIEIILKQFYYFYKSFLEFVNLDIFKMSKNEKVQKACENL
tara:strand:+ start:25424 stop:25591 length:168 start_codon:yes stop_codon:yes gene_type:complete